MIYLGIKAAIFSLLFSQFPIVCFSFLNFLWITWIIFRISSLYFSVFEYITLYNFYSVYSRNYNKRIWHHSLLVSAFYHFQWSVNTDSTYIPFLSPLLNIFFLIIRRCMIFISIIKHNFKNSWEVHCIYSCMCFFIFLSFFLLVQYSFLKNHSFFCLKNSCQPICKGRSAGNKFC